MLTFNEAIQIAYPPHLRPRTVSTCVQCGADRATGEPHVCGRDESTLRVGQRVWYLLDGLVAEAVVTRGMIFVWEIRDRNTDCIKQRSESDLFPMTTSGRERLREAIRREMRSLERQLETLETLELEVA